MKDFYGAEIKEITYKDGTKAQLGDVIRWQCFDNEEFTTWTFTGIYKSDKVVYLGGGIDFGFGIGQILSVESVIDDSQCSDNQGIEKIGVAKDVARIIGEIK